MLGLKLIHVSKRGYFVGRYCFVYSTISMWCCFVFLLNKHYNDVIMGAIACQITSLTIVYSTVYSGADERKHQSSASLAFGPANSPHQWPVTRKMFSFDDFIMKFYQSVYASLYVQHWIRLWLVACTTPSHYMNQYWFLVNWTLGTNCQLDTKKHISLKH